MNCHGSEPSTEDRAMQIVKTTNATYSIKGRDFANACISKVSVLQVEYWRLKTCVQHIVEWFNENCQWHVLKSALVRDH